MATNGSLWQATEPVSVIPQETENWYALHTRPRHEKIVVQRLNERGVETFLPIVNEVHRWSDRKKTLQLPLFTCYVFAKFVPNRMERLQVLRVGGVLGLVGSHGEGSPIPDNQIDAVRTLLDGSQDWATRANPQWRPRWSRRSVGVPQRKPDPCHLRGCDSTIAGSARRRISSRSRLSFSLSCSPAEGAPRSARRHN
jgi:hypothetical protein